ncbi:MAG: 16S rRNA (guanine(527)-N(7))-methyltransferase RsmG [Bacilli bacterium]|nr:16S rRNA (guanine(527)-N(7))-methyltransferase RsmG [Bacilli bacterium]MDD4076612.1 16S rRNA (guanine(527)-N(7))-methyltransferase RsmG [Bacilli bacterium]MDD4387932.1 16S rRNA (guanine(527)-N(7))-methyltransferase RsmG [Bacilli bacterium]
MILNTFNLSLKQIEQFNKYYKFLIEENQKYNLTSIIDRKEVYIKHFYDSLAACFTLDFFKINNYCDIGSGGGFPAIPLKVVFPHLKLTVVEPTKKKILFLQRLCDLLQISDIEFINQRAENFILNRREYYDLVSARAVAVLPVLLELVLPFLKVGGIFIAYKGSNYYEEQKASGNALKILFSVIENIYEYQLPENMGQHAIIKIRKQRETELVYPRRYAQIKKKHL